jgi:hypothetical protein
MNQKMYAGLWLFAWDLADEGVDSVMGWAADSGLTALQIAGSYHAGWFVHPHNPKHRIYMPQDGCIYFHPSMALYEDTILKPQVASVCAEMDWMSIAGDRAERFGLKLVSWTVCLHNTRLGLLHPECTVQNCFGDSYPHALCPANPNVRQYLIALCRDLAMHYPMHAIQLETPGYMGMKHGHHHERDLTVLTPSECALIDLCFCTNCRQQAESQQIDVAYVQATVRKILDDGMSAAPERLAGHPESLLEIVERFPQIGAFMTFRQKVEDSLIQEIKSAISEFGTLLYHFGAPNVEIASAVDVYNGSVYGQKAGVVRSETERWKRIIDERHHLYMGVRLGLNSVRDAGELTEIVAAIRNGGGDGVMFYNYSESPRSALNWIKTSLE